MVIIEILGNRVLSISVTALNENTRTMICISINVKR